MEDRSQAFVGDFGCVVTDEGVVGEIGVDGGENVTAVVVRRRCGGGR